MEVDFIYEEEGEIVPVEVKAADNTQAKSVASNIIILYIVR